MQVISSLLLLALGASALPSAPNTTFISHSITNPANSGFISHSYTNPANATINPLEARNWHYSWVGSSPALGCVGAPIGNRPQIKGNKCVPFKPVTNQVTIYWGTGALGGNKLKVYSSNDCSGSVWKAFTPQTDPKTGELSWYSCLGVGKKSPWPISGWGSVNMDG